MSVTPQPIGYLVPEFPGQTHAFFWREARAIEESGVPVEMLSTRRPAEGSCPHDFAASAEARTTYLFPPRVGPAAGFLAARPAALARALAYVAGLSETPPGQRARLFGLIFSAADLVLHCRTRGVAHVHIHSCANAAHLGALANILGGLAYSLSLHGDLPVYGTDHAAKMRRASFVSAVTAPLQAALTKEIGGDRRFPVIWMGVDTARFRPAPAPRPPGGPFEVVTIARLNATKGHRFFLRAMAQLRAEGLDIRYRIAGDGKERAAIEAEIARLDLGPHVELLGPVGEERVLTLLQGADTMALTSIQKGEAAPVAVMEAMACGLAPVCSIIGGTPDMIRDGEDGFLVPQEDVAAIARATGLLATTPVRRAAMGRAARQSAERLFDHRANALALYREIAASAGALA